MGAKTFSEALEYLAERGNDIPGTIRLSKETTGREAVGVFPIRTPEELVYAAGFLPVGMWGGKTEIKLADKYLQSFCCSIMRINLEFALKGVYNDLKAVMIPTFCDSMKCMVENWKLALPQIPTVAFAYPQHTKIEAGFQFVKDELQRVKRVLEEKLNVEITDEKLEEAFEIYEDYRAAMREFTDLAGDSPSISNRQRENIIKAGCFMDKKEYTELIRIINESLKKEDKTLEAGIKKVIITGLMAEPLEILDIMDEYGLKIAGDDVSLGSRIWRTPARPKSEVKDVWDRMAYIIHDIEGDTFFYDQVKSKGKMIIRMAEEKKADAVIVMMQKFCDPEEYDYPILKEELSEAEIPELYLEFDQQMTTFEQIRTRIQSFAEMIG